MDGPLYPVGLLVGGRRCLVVGGGRVAARKIASLLACGAAVTVVAPEAHEAVALLVGEGAIAAIDGPPLDLQLRPYRDGEAADYRLVITATGDAAVDGAVHRDAEAAGVWVNSADDPDHCTAVLPAVWRQGGVTVAVSSGGASPALSTWLRSRIAEVLGPTVGELAELLGEARRRVQAQGRSTEEVDWPALLAGPLPELVRQGRVPEARALLEEATDGGPGRF
ncbi:MAG: precorrin-2 dehydrogenase/sirohydrochlorin ferrochelatase family protein [Acidimicrobiales bacterium]